MLVHAAIASNPPELPISVGRACDRKVSWHGLPQTAGARHTQHLVLVVGVLAIDRAAVHTAGMDVDRARIVTVAVGLGAVEVHDTAWNAGHLDGRNARILHSSHDVVIYSSGTLSATWRNLFARLLTANE